MLKLILGIIEQPKKEPSMIIKVLDKAQYLMYVGIVIHMVMKLINTMKKTFGTDKGSSQDYSLKKASVTTLRSRSSR